MLIQGRKFSYMLIVVIVSTFLISCSRSAVNMAFSGKLPSVESNKVIIKYCQTCHVHKNKPSADHIGQQVARYKEEPFKNATECRVCHYIKKDFWGRIEQRTHFPEI